MTNVSLGPMLPQNGNKNTCETAQFYAQNFKTRPLELNTVWESCLFSRSESSN